MEQAADRAALRKQLRARRRALSAAQRQAAARQAMSHISRCALYQRSRHIAFYLPNDGELDLTPLLHRAWTQHKSCYLPVITLRGNLAFALYRADDPLAPNRFRIPEPCAPDLPLMGARALDLVLAPLVGFDAHGNRLGMGGGFYDRTLSFLRHRRHWRKPRLLGIAYACQRMPRLPREPWDVTLDAIATEEGIHFPSSPALE